MPGINQSGQRCAGAAVHRRLSSGIHCLATHPSRRAIHVIKSTQRIGRSTALGRRSPAVRQHSLPRRPRPPTPARLPSTPSPPICPLEIGALVQGGTGLTEEPRRLQVPHGRRPRRQSPYRQLPPRPAPRQLRVRRRSLPLLAVLHAQFDREICVPASIPAGISCSAPYTVGGTFTGVSITPIILRWNFVGTHRISPWVQGGRRRSMDQPQISSLWRPPLQPLQRRPQLRRQRLELHPAGRRRPALLSQPSPLHRLRRQRHPHLQRLPGRQKPWRQRQRPVLPRLHVVEVTNGRMERSSLPTPTVKRSRTPNHASRIAVL